MLVSKRLLESFTCTLLTGILISAPLAVADGISAPAVAGDGTSASALAPDGRSTPAGAVLRPAPSFVRAGGAAADSTIAALVAAVEEDSLYAFLARISGEVPVDLPWGSESILTRYAGGRGQDVAAIFLTSVFEGLGYDVEQHYFSNASNYQSVAVDAGGVGVTVGSKGRLLRTSDGSSWDRIWNGVETYTLTARDVVRTSATDWVAVGNGGFIATSDDGTQSWTERTSGTTERLNAVDVLASGVGWSSGRLGTILKTTDSGATWQAQTSGVTDLLYDVEALDDLTAVAVGAAGTILRTTDGGTSWAAVASGVSVNLLRSDFSGSSGWAVGASGTVVATTDAGATWSQQTSGTTLALNGVSFSSVSNGWAVGSQSTVLRTTDGGTTWTPQIGPASSLTLMAIDAVSASEAWLVGVAGTLFRTTDGGTTWEDRGDTIRDGWMNVVATLAGTTNAVEEVLLVGHYDSTSPEADTLAPGADDNGSGIAVIVEAARLARDARFERTIRFICLAAEEGGLHGSAAYAQRAAARGDQLHAVLNLDSVGWNDDYHRIFSNDDSAWLGDITLQTAATHTPWLTTFHWYCPTCTWSDHASFWTQGFDAIVGIETWDPAPPQHHTIGDTIDLMDIPLVADVTKIYLATVATLAEVDTTDVTSVDLGPSLPLEGVRLHAGVPNPTSGVTTLRFDLPWRAEARLAIYDVGGRLVRELARGSKDAGQHSAVWDGLDRRGRPVAAGIYFSRLEAGGEVRTKTVTVLR